MNEAVRREIARQVALGFQPAIPVLRLINADDTEWEGAAGFGKTDRPLSPPQEE